MKIRATRRPHLRAAAVVSTVALAAATLTACTGSSGPSPQQKQAEQFLTAFGSGQVTRAAALTDTPAAAQTALRASMTGLGSTARGQFDVTSVKTSNQRATASYTARWTLPGSTAAWTYRGTLPLSESGKKWTVQWRITDLHPGLSAGTHLAVLRGQPERAALLDAAGKPLFADTPVVRVGIEKKLVDNLGSLASTLAAIPQLESTRTEIIAAVSKAQPTDFVPVITLRRTVYEQIKPKIYNLPGTVFQSDTLLLTASAHFGQPLLGTVGPATAEIVAQSHGLITAADTTGIGGLQQAYNKTLAGTDGISVDAVPDVDSGAPRRLSTVTAPRAGRPVKLTLSSPTQAAAEQALSSVSKPAAIVAVQRSTGRILADADTAAVTYDYGLAGAFPPGSTFKIATWTAAFTADPGLTPKSTLPCLGTFTVDGRRFVNENKFSHPPISVADAFAYSCNTTAIAEALTLPSTSLADAAKQLGLGAKWSLPVPAFSGSIPVPVTKTERAADAIGQGRVLASPLVMALMASAADGGKVLAPTIDADTPPSSGAALPATLTGKMHTLLNATVQLAGGTAHELAPLGDVVGKTGTAEYGTATPPRSHSWFVGVQGDVAFAAFVYDGATTGIKAVSIGGDFLQRLS